ncbi:hypothetical protein [Paenibacillus konkukensis]|uniref:hypothetical protein n=1 Tax=Paenibacillus konkukensis TaxID=2020716 RepID=UPI00201DAB15|nr:hypothetical protein [Paenibacillus konkukensis]
MLRAIIADDETMIKKSLKVIMERTGLAEVIGAFTNGRDTLDEGQPGGFAHYRYPHAGDGRFESDRRSARSGE